MPITSGFFNSVNGDRRYKAEDFARFFARFIANGVFPDPSTGFQVIANGDMTVSLRPGDAWIFGFWINNDSNYVMPLDIADGVLKRIDRIALRLTYLNREIIPVVKNGVPSSSPVAPVLQRDADAYEIALADVYINNGAISISQANITDQRMNTDLCGVVTGILGHIDTTDLFAQYQVTFNEWFADAQGTLSGDVAGNLLAQINDLKNDMTDVNAAVGNGLNKYKSNKDEREIFTTIEWKRTNGTLAKKSVMSNPDIDGYYQTQTIDYYDASGLVIEKTEVYTIGYDADGNDNSEVLQ